MPRNYAKKKKSHKAAMVTIFVVVAFFCGTLSVSNWNKQKELDRDQKEIERLEAEIAVQEKRTLDLNDLKVYVKTMRYVEEKAKELGLVYKDEMVFKPR
ncbi:MAG: septum formation initiator family protein [Lachnospiraceae bacterium]|nr:septum formation initiator family protein [Lachnospiraceae bacterium]